ncbi:Respiratory nitrate reductase alpha chain [Brachybacterium nesterenkovii]|uniref:Respiratory nitrate reductase alpha chain n=1 Tax=Brachybacterium nesterenkovii TaxID=47847 RepID=A0A1X6X1Z5_9MICO|nr:Respiratory nitrate reductase alpha chain [Brachybacterium nesterenkovii]
MTIPDEKPVAHRAPGIDSPLSDALIGTRRFFRSSKEWISEDNRETHRVGGRSGDSFYRERWSHDKVVRSTHGVNCTGSCSWKVYVKDGVITWESQETDYPTAGPDRPEYEPRGCPRGASFSWYTYSPTRVRYPYVRSELLRMYREEKATAGGDPVAAWRAIVSDPVKAKRYKEVRGKGGLVRAPWDEAIELVAAAYVHTTKEFGPDRATGFSPIPAMSQVSFSSGPASTSSSAARCCRSTTGTRISRRPPRRSSATRPTSRSRGTGGTPPTSSCGARTSR